MNLYEKDLPYLIGDMYSNGRVFNFNVSAQDRLYRSRSDVLVDLVRGKKIVHIGCVDHDVDSIEKKIKKGKWLHKILHDASDRCFGIDIEKEGIDFIRKNFGYDDLAVIDITSSLPKDLEKDCWDYVLIPEVLEHINNPAEFLRGIKKQFTGVVDKFILTVPNAFSYENFKHAKKDTEVINTDHRYWFTPFTLSKIVSLTGFSIDEIIMCRHGRVKKRSVFKNSWYRRNPLMRSDIVMLMTSRDEELLS